MALRWRRVLGGTALTVVTLPLVAMGAMYWRVSHPPEHHAPVPPGLLALGTPEGDALLGSASARADLGTLQAVFQSQEKGTWCGVASSTMVLDALQDGPAPTQDAFFTPGTAAIRSWLRITFSGMPLDDLGRLLEAHGVRAQVTHAGDSTVEVFRREAIRNLESPGDYLLVNYRRAELGQGRAGHISPLGAYDAATDRFLVLDVTTYKWPPVWVEARALFAAMDTIDSEVELTRGWVTVSAR
jgi:hypothetical protein